MCSYQLIQCVLQAVHSLSSHRASSCNTSCNSLIQSGCLLWQTCTRHPLILSKGYSDLPLLKCILTEQTGYRSQDPYQVRLCRLQFLGYVLEQSRCKLHRREDTFQTKNTSKKLLKQCKLYSLVLVNCLVQWMQTQGHCQWQPFIYWMQTDTDSKWITMWKLIWKSMHVGAWQKPYMVNRQSDRWLCLSPVIHILVSYICKKHLMDRDYLCMHTSQ